MIAHTYTLHLSCPVCGHSPVHHVGSIPPDMGVVGAWAQCLHCDTDITITVEMTHKQRRHGNGPVRKNRLPLQPLLTEMGCATYNEFGALVGLSREVVQRLSTQGVTIERADELAVLCGLHAASVWGDDFFQALEAAR